MDSKVIEKSPEIIKNMELVAKYPFLAMREYDWKYYEETGEDRYIIPDDYDYEFTWLDSMPNGWRIAFGEQMCEEIMNALIEEDFVDKYSIMQIKEKFGSLRWYTSGAPQKVHDIVDKYELISERTCINCGKPATKISMGWICPWCDDCAKNVKGEFWDIDEYFEK